METPNYYDPDSALGEDLLAEVADLRARGRSWEEVAAEVQWDVRELRRALRNDRAYERALDRARREIDDEAEAEGLQRLRVLARDSDASIAKSAASIILRHVAAKRSDETRLEVERVRARTRTSRATSKCGANEEGEEEPWPERSPEHQRKLDEFERKRQAEAADEWARGVVAVYLWGGCHRTDAPPDKTDTPLLLFRAESPGAGPAAYWATTAIPPVLEPLKGPFLAPPGLRPCIDPPRESDAPPG